MTYEEPSQGERIVLDQEERDALGKLAQGVVQDVVRHMNTSKSFRRRFGNSGIRRLGIIIKQDPSNPDLVMICTEVEVEDADVACWCEPPGTCEPGPC